jgi:hypothetical protein
MEKDGDIQSVLNGMSQFDCSERVAVEGKLISVDSTLTRTYSLHRMETY